MDEIKEKDYIDENGNVVKGYYSQLSDLNEKYFGEASGHHEEYLDEYRKNEEKLYQWQKKQLEQQADDYKTAMDYIDKQLNKMLDSLKDEEDDETESIQEDIDALNDEKDEFDDAEQAKIDKLNDEKDAFDETTQTKIDALSDEKEAFETTMEAEIDALNDKKDAESTEWQAKIDALSKENDALEKQKELQELLENLATAKSTRVKVLKNGRFQYVTDQNEVDTAQKALNDYYTSLKEEQQKQALEDAKNAAEENYQKQIDDLTAYEKNVSKNYQSQIDNLNTLVKNTDKDYDAQIKAIENYVKQMDDNYDDQLKDLNDYMHETKADYDEQVQDMQDYIDEFEDLVNSYQDKENEHIANMLTNGQAENDEWLLRINNLKAFVDEYNNQLDKLDKDEEEADSGSGSSSSSSSGGYGPTGSDSDKNTYVSVNGGSYIHGSGKVIHRAGGGIVGDNEITLVGDDPNNSELVVGSKLNGSVMKLGSGAGVIPHLLSDTLISMAQIFGSDKYGSNITNKTVGNSIHIGNISLPQVKNGEDFVKYLSNFNMTQFAYSH